MKSPIIFKKRHALKMLMLTLVAGLAILVGSYRVYAASCMDLSDVPLDSLEQAAPGMIMFVLDDSGSMDWSMMCPPAQETNGVFDGYEYIFANPGDDVFTIDSLDDNLEDDPNNRMMWMSQWAGSEVLAGTALARPILAREARACDPDLAAGEVGILRELVVERLARR